MENFDELSKLDINEFADYYSTKRITLQVLNLINFGYFIQRMAICFEKTGNI